MGRNTGCRVGHRRQPLQAHLFPSFRWAYTEPAITARSHNARISDESFSTVSRSGALINHRCFSTNLGLWDCFHTGFYIIHIHCRVIPALELVVMWLQLFGLRLFANTGRGTAVH